MFKQWLDEMISALDSPDAPSEKVEYSAEEFSQNLSNYSSTGLCSVIATYRFLGLSPEFQQIAMTELTRRRTAGDLFNFESKIEEYTKMLPKNSLNQEISLQDLVANLSNLTGQK